MSNRQPGPTYGEIICAEYFIFQEPLCDYHRKILDGTVDAFIKVEQDINSECDDKVGGRRKSNEVLSMVREHLEGNGWEVEHGKRIVVSCGEAKINPDARFREEKELKAILEVEGPRAWVASAWAKDLTKAMKTKQDYLVLAVRKRYTAGSATASNDFKRIGEELKQLNDLPINAVLLIGY